MFSKLLLLASFEVEIANLQAGAKSSNGNNWWSTADRGMAIHTPKTTIFSMGLYMIVAAIDYQPSLVADFVFADMQSTSWMIFINIIWSSLGLFVLTFKFPWVRIASFLSVNLKTCDAPEICKTIFPMTTLFKFKISNSQTRAEWKKWTSYLKFTLRNEFNKIIFI